MSYLLQPEDEVIYVPEMAPDMSPGNDLLALWRLVRLMRKLRPVIVHTHTAKAGCLGRLAACLAGVPRVVHSYHGNVLSGYFSPSIGLAVRVAERFLGRVTNAVCVLSEQQKRELTDQFRVSKKEKVLVIPLGLDLDELVGINPPMPHGRLTVGWFGRFVPIKNISLLTRVMELSLSLNPAIRFVVAGSGPDLQVLREAADRLGPGRVGLYPWQQDLRPLMAECDVLLQTSLNEGTPTALIQGMAAGRTFVSTAVGGVVDMVSGPMLRNGTGRWFANGVLTGQDPEEIARVIVELSRNPDQVAAMGRAARVFALQNYQLNDMIDRIEALYRTLLEGKSPARHGACTPLVS